MRSTDRKAIEHVAAVYSVCRVNCSTTARIISQRTRLSVHHVNKILQRNPTKFEQVGKQGNALLWKRKY